LVTSFNGERSIEIKSVDDLQKLVDLFHPFDITDIKSITNKITPEQVPFFTKSITDDSEINVPDGDQLIAICEDNTYSYYGETTVTQTSLNDTPLYFVYLSNLSQWLKDVFSKS
jgi:hypothetical protein